MSVSVCVQIRDHSLLTRSKTAVSLDKLYTKEFTDIRKTMWLELVMYRGFKRSFDARCTRIVDCIWLLAAVSYVLARCL